MSRPSTLTPVLLARTAAAWLVTLVLFFPLGWLALTAFKTELQAIAVPPQVFFTPTLENFHEVQERSDYLHYAWNSVVTSVLSTLLGLLLAGPAAYAMAFFKGPRTKDILMWMLSTKMMPAVGQVLLPLSLGSFASTGLLCLVLSWNEAFWSLNLSAANAGTLAALIAQYSSPEGLFWAKLSAASLLAIAPIVVFGWFSQKQLVQGLTFGAVK
ncbi:MAG: hypothetical protein RL223_4624 [Pseudomonadota bacterium]